MSCFPITQQILFNCSLCPPALKGPQGHQRSVIHYPGRTVSDALRPRWTATRSEPDERVSQLGSVPVDELSGRPLVHGALKRND